MRSVVIAGCFLLASAGAIGASEKSPLDSIDRTIAKEPSYRAKEPWYTLIAIGPQAKARLWMVLDKSAPDGKLYDVLYFDRNGNGDLTESGERFATPLVEHISDRVYLTFNLPDIEDAATGHKHTEVRVMIVNEPMTPPRHFISLKWRGRLALGTGSRIESDPRFLRFAASAAKAPVAWLNGEAPMTFHCWMGDVLEIGTKSEITVYLASRSDGRNPVCALREFAIPDGEPIRAKLRYTDTAGKRREVTSELLDRC
jgi:hypothetical protein